MPCYPLIIPFQTWLPPGYLIPQLPRCVAIGGVWAALLCRSRSFCSTLANSMASKANVENKGSEEAHRWQEASRGVCTAFKEESASLPRL